MSSYRLRNWMEYERALEARGRITLWLSAETLAAWRAERPGTARRGHPREYSDAAITALLTLSALFQLGLRETVGLARSFVGVLDLGLRVPHHTTLSRRRAQLALTFPVRPVPTPLHLVIDSTGMALHGEGSWQQHRWGPHHSRTRRSWTRHYLRVHFGVDAATGEVRTLGVSAIGVHDCEMLPRLLAAHPAPLAQVTADGAYDTWACYAAVAARPEQPRAVFPPPKTRHKFHRPRIRQHGNTHAPPLDRDEHLRHIRRVGRRQWKRDVAYHRRSLAETLVSRYKRLVGERLRARTFAGQCREVCLAMQLLNRFLALGRPDSYCVA
jgi:Transposase DDE domain